ncbi:hypothetical protein VULLAG_LOCUS13078 [Vulpes lagopus]
MPTAHLLRHPPSSTWRPSQQPARGNPRRGGAGRGGALGSPTWGAARGLAAPRPSRSAGPRPRPRGPRRIPRPPRGGGRRRPECPGAFRFQDAGPAPPCGPSPAARLPVGSEAGAGGRTRRALSGFGMSVPAERRAPEEPCGIQPPPRGKVLLATQTWRDGLGTPATAASPTFLRRRARRHRGPDRRPLPGGPGAPRSPSPRRPGPRGTPRPGRAGLRRPRPRARRPPPAARRPPARPGAPQDLPGAERTLPLPARPLPSSRATREEENDAHVCLRSVFL